MDFLKIAKQVYAAGLLLKVVEKYLDKIKKEYEESLVNGKLLHNICMRIKINKHDIKNKFNEDFNYVFVQFSNKKLNRNKIIQVGIDCNSNFVPIMDFPQDWAGYANTGDDQNPDIHIGINLENPSWQNYQDTVQHQLVHCFQLFYGYKNKNLSYYQDDEAYNNSFLNIENSNNFYDYFDWKNQDYYSSTIEFSTYLTNLISMFRKLYQKINDKNKLKQLINKTNFSDSKSVRRLCGEFSKNKIFECNALIWAYHLKNENPNLFSKAIKKLLNKINSF